MIPAFILAEIILAPVLAWVGIRLILKSRRDSAA